MDPFDIRDYGKMTRIHPKKEIFAAEHLSTKKIHVLKIIKIPYLNEINDALTEAFVHSRVVPHPNVIDIYGRYLGFEKDDLTGDLRATFIIDRKDGKDSQRGDRRESKRKKAI